MNPEDPLAQHYQELIALFGPDSKYRIKTSLDQHGYYWLAWVDDVPAEDRSWRGVVEKLKGKIGG